MMLLMSFSIEAKKKKDKTPVEKEKSSMELAIESINAANTAYEDTDFETSIRHFNEAINYLKQAETSAAESDSIPIQIFRLKMNVAKIHNDYAFYLSEKNDFDEALVNYESSLALYKALKPESTPQDSIDVYINKLYRNSAICSRQTGEYQKAIEYYDLYLEANPDDDDILLQKFAIYKDNMKDENQAFQVLQEYANNKNDFNASHRLGDLYRNKNDMDNALIWYNKALSIKNDMNILQKIGSIHRTKQQWALANTAFERFIALNPNSEELKTAYKLIGDNYKNLNNKPKAVEYFDKYLAMEYNEDIALYICLYYYDAKNNSQMIKYANLILSNNSNNTTAYLFRGIARYNTKDMKGAKADFERIQNDPKNGKTAQQYLKIIK